MPRLSIIRPGRSRLYNLKKDSAGRLIETFFQISRPGRLIETYWKNWSFDRTGCLMEYSEVPNKRVCSLKRGNAQKVL